MTYEVFEDKVNAGDWRVEGLNVETGDCEITIFAGSRARERSYQYFNIMTEVKNGN